MPCSPMFPPYPNHVLSSFQLRGDELVKLPGCRKVVGGEVVYSGATVELVVAVRELAAIKHLTISRWYYTIRGREFSPWGSVIIWGVIEGEREDDFRNMGDRVLWWGFVKGMERGARGSNVYRVLKGFEIKLKGLVENE